MESATVVVELHFHPMMARHRNFDGWAKLIYKSRLRIHVTLLGPSCAVLVLKEPHARMLAWWRNYDYAVLGLSLEPFLCVLIILCILISLL
jgi:hypothetical protein